MSRGGFRTRREVEHAFAELRDEIRRGEYVAPLKITVAVFLQGEWLPAVRASIRAGTWGHDASALRRQGSGRVVVGHQGYDAIQALNGVGPILGVIFVAEIGDLTRSSSARHLCSWAGLTPSHRESDQ